MATTISIDKGKRSLAILWFVGGLFTMVLLAVQSSLGKYGEDPQGAWAWFLPTVLPTFSLIVGVIAADAKAPPKGGNRVQAFAFRLAFSFSALYLALVALVPLIQPLVGIKPLVLMKMSNLWLAPLQGLAAALLGIFFVKGERESGR